MRDKVSQFLNSRFGDNIIREDDQFGYQTFVIKAEVLSDICRILYETDSMMFKLLSDITSVDWLETKFEEEGRFEVVYTLYSISKNHRIMLRVFLSAEDPTIESLTTLWEGANWLEREVWDLMGIKFTGHPELTKILTADELEGHPLRRDFPLTYEVPQFSWNKEDPPEVIR